MDERAALAGLSFLEVAGGTGRAPIHRYQFPPQEVELRGGESLYTFGGAPFGTVTSISIDARTVDIKKRQDTAAIHADAAFAHEIVRTDVIADALLRIGECVADSGISGGGAYRAARSILLRLPPETSGEPLRRPGETAVQAAVRIAPRLSSGVLSIQGPPGTGKTFTAARLICALANANRRI